MYKQLKEQKGFTIVEVLIVLAIAGLILLIVFLAVPALQRNARNTSRKEDASHLLAAISEYVGNNNGTLPSNINITSGVATLCNNATCSGTDAQAKSNLGYYTAVSGAGGITAYGAGVSIVSTPAAPPATAVDSLTIAKGEVCSGNTITTTGASTNSYVAVQGIEASGGFSWICEQD